MSRKNIEEVCGYLDESFESDSDSLLFVDDSDAVPTTGFRVKCVTNTIWF